MSAKAPTARLDKLLANLGYGSRREIAGLARAGRIVLDGAALADAGARIAVKPDLPARLAVDGAGIDPPPGLALMLHKPLGVTCSHKEAGPLVYGLLPERWRRRDPALSTVGRLDKETSGLLLLRQVALEVRHALPFFSCLQLFARSWIKKGYSLLLIVACHLLIKITAT